MLVHRPAATLLATVLLSSAISLSAGPAAAQRDWYSFNGSFEDSGNAFVPNQADGSGSNPLELATGQASNGYLTGIGQVPLSGFATYQVGTVAFWLTVTGSSTADQTLLQLQTTGSGNNTDSQLTFDPVWNGGAASRLRISRGNGPNSSTLQEVLIQPALARDQQHHVVFTMDRNSGDLVVYINGEVFRDGLSSPYDDSKPAVIATLGAFEDENTGNFSRDFNGQLHDFRVWNDPIDPELVADLFRRGAASEAGRPRVANLQFQSANTSLGFPLTGRLAAISYDRSAISDVNQLFANGLKLNLDLDGTPPQSNDFAERASLLLGGAFDEMAGYTFDLWVNWLGQPGERQPILECGGLEIYATSQATQGIVNAQVPNVAGGPTGLPASSMLNGPPQQLTVVVNSDTQTVRAFINGQLAVDSTGTAPSASGGTFPDASGPTFRDVCALGDSFRGQVISARLYNRAFLQQPFIDLLVSEGSGGPDFPLPDVLVRTTSIDGALTMPGGGAIPFPATAVFSTDQPTLDLSGAYSPSEFTVDEFRWHTDQGAEGTVTFDLQNLTWSIDDIPLAAAGATGGAANVITIEALDVSGRVLGSHTLEVTANDTTDPTLQIFGPDGSPAPATLFTTRSTISLHGTAGDDFGVAEVRWNDNGVADVEGIALGSDNQQRGNTAASWFARELPLREVGTDVPLRLCASDTSGRQTCSTVQVRRIDPAATLRINGTEVSAALDVAAPGSIQVTVPTLDLDVDAVAVLLNGVALPGTLARGAQQTWTGALPLADLPEGTLADLGDPAYELEVRVGFVDGSSKTLGPYEIGVLSGVTPATATEITSTWDGQAAPPAPELNDLSLMDNAGQLAGFALSGPPVTFAGTDTAEVVDGEIRYVTELSAVGARQLLQLEGGSWFAFSAAQLGLSDTRLTAVAYQPAMNRLWIGTDRGLLVATPGAGGAAPTVIATLGPANGLAGDLISDLDLDPASQKLLVGHYGRRYYRLNENAVRRYWEVPGGISIHDGGASATSGWSSQIADLDDFDNWLGPQGFEITGAAWAGGMGTLWITSEVGVAQFDVGANQWTDRSPGLPVARALGVDSNVAGTAWVRSSDGAAFWNGGGWERFDATTPDTLPSSEITQLIVDLADRAWFATPAGLTSYDTEQVWSAHPGAGAGAATALHLAEDGAVLAATAFGGAAALAVAELGLAPLLDLPADASFTAADPLTGLGTATFSWELPTGASGAEWFLNGALVRRLSGSSFTATLPEGVHRWSVRALFADGTHGAFAPAREFTVAGQRRGTAREILLSRLEQDLSLRDCCTSDRRAAGLYLRQLPDSSWQTSSIEPGFVEIPADTPLQPEANALLDLALGADLDLATTLRADGSTNSFVNAWPEPLIPLVPAQSGSNADWRIDRTSETRGLVWCNVGADVFTLYNDFSSTVAVQPTVQARFTPGATCRDVAGLADGRAIGLGGVGAGAQLFLYERLQAFAEVERVRAPVPTDGSAIAVAGLREGGFYVLTATELIRYDQQANELLRSPLPAATPPARDLAVDQSGEVFVLFASDLAAPTTPAAQLFAGVPQGPATPWTAVPLTGFENEQTIGSVSTPMTPRGLGEVDPVPYDPPMPPGSPPAGTTTLLNPLTGDPTFFVAGNFAGNTATTGTTTILGFLEADLSDPGASLTVNNDSSIVCTGPCPLRLNYGTGYAKAVAFPTAQFPSGIELISAAAGGFTISLSTGGITPTSGTLSIDLLDLAPITATSMHVLDMGPFENGASRTGVGLVGRFDFASVPGVASLGFSQLLLGDFGGEFHASFGEPGLPGLDPALSEAALQFVDNSGVPLAFPGGIPFPALEVQGGIRTAGDPGDQGFDDLRRLSFDLAEVRTASGCDDENVCPQEFVLFVNDLEIGEYDDGGTLATGVRFGAAGSNFAGILITRIDAGRIVTDPVSPCDPDTQDCDAGIYADTAAWEFPFGDQAFTVTEFYAGPAGLRFEEADEFSVLDFTFNFAGVNLDLAEQTFEADFAAVQRDVGDPPNPNQAFAGKFDNLFIPFSFFFSPPQDFPSADAGFLRLGPEMDPLYAACFGNISSEGPESPCDEADDPPPTASNRFTISPERITIPPLFLKAKSPEFTFDLSGGATVTRDYIELGDVPEIPLYGGTLDFARTRLARRSFFTSSGVFERNAIQASLTDFEISFDPAATRPIDTVDVSISGGSFFKAGVGFEFSNLEVVRQDPPSGNDVDDILGYDLDFRTLGFPVLRDVSGELELRRNPQDFRIRINEIAAVDVGPLRLRNIKFSPDGPAAPPGGSTRYAQFGALPPGPGVDGDEFYFSGGVGYGRLPDVFGEVWVKDRKLEFLGLKAVFPAPGRPIGNTGTFLQQVDGSYNRLRREVKAGVVITGGPELSFSPWVSEPFRLFTLRGEATLSGLGYLHSTANVRLFEGPNYGGFEVGNAELWIGRVYRDGNFIGNGLWFNGQVVLFGGVLNVGTTAWIWENGGGRYGANMAGSMQVPGYVPIIGGRSFGSVSANLAGTVDPPTGSIGGSVSITLFCVPFGGCVRIGVGWEIDSGGFSAFGPESVRRQFDHGYASASGITVLNNYRLLSNRTALSGGTPTQRGTNVQTFDFNVPSGVRDAVVRIDTTDVAGDAVLALEFPDGQQFTSANTPTITESADLLPEDGLVPIFYRKADVSGPTAGESLQESAFIFRGPFAFTLEEVLDVDGNPTGEFVEVLDTTDVPAGTYRVTVESTGDIGSAPIDFLLGNHAPELVDFTVEDLGGDRYRVTWQVEDADGDPVTVRGHAGTDLEIPLQSYPFGPAQGFPAAGPINEMVFDLTLIAEEGITAPLHLFLSLDDGFDQAVFVPLTVVAPCISPKAPPQVQSVVARLDEEAVRFFWDPVATAAPGTILTRYTVAVEEVGPDGATAPIDTTTIEIPVPGRNPRGEGPLDGLTEAYVTDLLAGHVYSARVTAVAEEVLAGQGPPLCDCGAVYEPGDFCHPDNDPPQCDVPTDEIVDHPGVPSAPLLFQLVGDSVNNLPRLLNSPQTLVRLDDVYRSLIRVEDLDGESVTATFIDTIVPPDPNDPPGTPPTVVPPLAGLTITPGSENTFLLAYDPIEGDIGRNPLTLRLEDPRGGRIEVPFPLDVVHFGEVDLDATFTSLPGASVTLGESYLYAPEITCTAPAAMVPLRWQLTMAPNGMTVDPESGLLQWSPLPTQIGNHLVALEVLVDDPTCSNCPLELAGSQAWQVQVLDNPLVTFGPVLSATPAQQLADSSGDVLPLTIDNLNDGETMTWTAEVVNGGAWVTLAPLAGNGDGSVTATVAANPDETERTATVRITALDGAGMPAIESPRELTITQVAANLSVLALQGQPTEPISIDGQNVTLQVRNLGGGTMDWTAVVDQGASFTLLEDPTNGTNDGTVTAMLGVNDSGTQRTALVRAVAAGTPGSPADVALLQLGADLAVAEAAAAPPVDGGQPIVAEVRVDNPTPLASSGVTLFVEVPAATTFDLSRGSDWSCPQGIDPGDICSSSVGTIGGGTSAQRSIPLVVDASVPAGLEEIRWTVAVADDGSKGADGRPEDNEVEMSVVVLAVPDLSAVATGPAATSAGSLLTVELGAANVGTQSATGVLLETTVPDQTVFDPAASAPEWSCSATTAGSTCTLALGEVGGAGAQQQHPFAVRVDNPVAPGVDDIVFAVTASDDGSNGSDPDPSNDRSTLNVSLDAVPDLEVQLGATTAQVLPGEVASVEFQIVNVGSQVASGVEALATVAVGSTFDAAASLGAWNCSQGDPAPTICRVALGELRAGERGGTVRFAVRVDLPATAGLESIDLLLDAADDGSNGDDPTSNGVLTTVPLQAFRAVSAIKSASGIDLDDNGRLGVGDRIAYQIALRNDGNQNAGDVVLDDQPDEVTFLLPETVTATGGSFELGTGPGDTSIRLIFDELRGAGELVVLSYEVEIRPTSPGEQQAFNQASIVGANIDPVLSEDAETGGATVVDIVGDVIAIPVGAPFGQALLVLLLGGGALLMLRRHGV